LWQTESSCGETFVKTVKFLALAILFTFAASTARSANREIYPDPAQAKSRPGRRAQNRGANPQAHPA